jgi:acyl-[acyl-carrier-protein]-phospholipid O-acyltransferase/long-chain-fatty-acid--[acyl-carrier-protein] ligase
MDDGRPAAPSSLSAGGGLTSSAFLGLLATQILTALSDNIFRWLVVGIGKDHVAHHAQGSGTSGWLTDDNILMAATICMVAPYLLLAAPAGYLADRFPKRSVIVGCKSAEIVLMLLGVVAILCGQLPPAWALGALFAVVALLGAQSAMFSPARTASIPETVRPELISKANGLFSLGTVIAAVVGMVIGNALSDATGDKGLDRWWLSGIVLVGVALAGTISSLLIAERPAGDKTRRFPWDALPQTWRDLRLLAGTRPLFRVALGIAFFYAVAALAQMNIDQLVDEGMRSGQAPDSAKSPLLLALIAGMCAGSVLAGIWSKDHVELGIVPLGALGITLNSLLLFTVPHVLFEPDAGVTAGYIWAGALLLFLGISAGLFDVPLAAYLQHRSPLESRGSILAASNFLTFGGVLLAALLFAVLRMRVPSTRGSTTPLLNPQQIFLLAGLLTIPVFLYIVLLIPQASIRFFVWLLSHTVYRIRVHGRENLPRTGGALLVPNHVTWADGILLMLTSSRPIRMVAWASNIESRPWIKRLAQLFGAIPIDPARPKRVIAALQTAREALQRGELVCIFPEGGLSRTGQVQAFKPGLMKILEGSSAPVIPVYLGGLWGSIFSFKGGKFFWKWPERIPYPMSIHFGPPITEPSDPHQVRQAVLALGAAATQESSQSMMLVTRSFIRQCKSRKRTPKIADSTGTQLTGGQALMRALILRRMLKRTLAPDEQYVGLLLPPTVPGFLANVALALDRRISCNLNYTVSSDVMNACIQHAGIKHVITSRKFMEKMGFQLNAQLLYLEDFKERPTLADKAAGFFCSYLLPAGLLDRALGLTRVSPSDVLTVVFTSGSTGTPKGVVLTHANIGSNVEAIDQVIHLRPSDVLIGILPFFHSFGYTVTLWGVGSLDISGAYHFSPLDARQIGKLTQDQKGTLLVSTPTFLRTYLRRCEKEELGSLDVVVCGAEHLPKDLADEFEKKFGVRPIEGYGTTELSPLVSVNVPPSRSSDNFQPDRKEGSVGRPVPGVSAKVTDLDTGLELPAGRPGMLWITGPNVMQGYLHRPDLTSQVIKDGWYQTGDVAVIDEQGFIHITGRESRFSKIGGEMVPHIKIEEEIERLLGASEDGKPQVAVTAVPDPKKGERLIVLHTKLSKPVPELLKGLTKAGLPNLYIPAADSFLEVPELPILGTGKLDLRGIKNLALEKVTPVKSSS